MRLALLVGNQLVFSPFYHPGSNGYAERFRQDYGREVWQKLHLETIEAVRVHSSAFFDRYRCSEHHSALRGQSPAAVHAVGPTVKWRQNFRPPDPLPLTEGKIHFMRQVAPDKHIKILNVSWAVLRALPGQGVWATLELRQSGAKLRVFDAAPDAPQRRCLEEHPFPLKEPVVPLPPQFRRSPPAPKRRWVTAYITAMAALFHDVVKVSSLVKVPLRSAMS